MSVSNTVNDLMNQTAMSQALDRQQQIRDSITNPDRNVGGMMGKNDFLKLLSVQLRHQNPLEPKNDGDFAAQLAQFSSLEQMMNMNETMLGLSNQHSFSLVGRGVMGIAEIDGQMQPFAGILDNIFTIDGVQWAVINEEGGTQIRVPMSAITGVFDSSTHLTPGQFLTTANNLIGREVKAEWEDEIIEGIVTRITVDAGFMYAEIQRPDGTTMLVPVGAIFDIRQPGTVSNPPQEQPAEEEAAPQAAENVNGYENGYGNGNENGYVNGNENGYENGYENGDLNGYENGYGNVTDYGPETDDGTNP
jgi:flagellar basal-body rod modification protein FlgD